MDEKVKEAFGIAVEELLSIEIDKKPYVLCFPRTLFASAIHVLKKGEKFSEEECRELMKEFIRILDEKNVRIDNKSFLKSFRKREKIKRKNHHGRPEWVTEEMMTGAVRADFRHRQMLGDDY